MTEPTSPRALQTTPVSRLWSASGLRRAAVVTGALCLTLWAVLAGWPEPPVATDVDQQRLNVALAPPSRSSPIAQTFRPEHDGLQEVAVLLARRATEESLTGTLTLSLQAEGGDTVAAHSWSAERLQHNQTLALRFPPQWRSAGQTYTLTAVGEGNNPFSLWAYDMDVYEGGQLQGPTAGQAQELRFTTRYALGWRTALARSGALVQQEWVIVGLALALILMPGCLLLLAARRRLPRLDLGAWWGLALALGLATWPHLWFWPTLAGARWTTLRLALFLGGGWLVSFLLFVRKMRRDPGEAGPDRRASTSGEPGRQSRRFLWRFRAAAWRKVNGIHLLLLALLLLALVLRLLAVRDLAFPPWVDSSRHALISTLMASQGQTPDDYQPYLAIDRFDYHFGFHTLPAGLRLLGLGPLPRLLLVSGQLLNALAPLAVYSATWLVTRRRRLALLAAFLVALPFFFPAYYVTWGRYTQLTGALLLAPLIGLTWLLHHGARGWRRAWWLVGLLVAGLFLVHVRVFLVYLPLAMLAWLVARGRGGRALLAAAIMALVLSAPRLWQLLPAAGDSGMLATASESYAAFPMGYVRAGWERWFLLAGGVTLLGLIPPALRGRRPALAGLTLVAWAGAVGLLLSGWIPGVPTVWLLNINSAYILIFIPLALVLALGFDHAWRRLQRSPWSLQATGAAILGATLVALLLFGLRQQVDILNPTTLLTRPQDEAGLAWAGEHIPSEAFVAVNSWRWLGTTWAGADGGAWLLPLTGLSSTTPTADYAVGNVQLAERVNRFNQAAMEVSDWSTPEAAQWLRQQGVSHVFVGARGGFFDPSMLAGNPQMRLLYQRDGVFIFALE